ncbi:Cytochrome P450 [Mycena venus]|uniref:Cytochrome P450 n=1 Tax=Mycena venus TaxID=2733690 RepID=A0A8H7D661_9AGAR|nr:Cytochrome P450 [Mycena venus]
MFTPTITDGIVAAAALGLCYRLYKRWTALPLPPGPNGLPLIGNVLDMPKSHAWKTFAQWGDIYGGIMSVTLLGQPFVILNDPAMATEILDKRGNLYADRPTLEMAHMSGWDRVLGGTRYGDKEYRWLIGKVIGTKGSVVKFNAVEEYQANMLLKRVLEDPRGFDAATRKTMGALALHLTYGYKIKEEGNDPLVDLADKAVAEFSEVTRPGAFLVDVMPILKYVPSWFPGAGFKSLAKTCKKSSDDLADVPFAYVQEQMLNGQETESYVSNLLHEKDLSEERLNQIKWSASSLYAGAADTTVCVVTAYFLAAAKYPEIQTKAQAEIDAVVGQNRLPTLEDRKSLPYIEAICKELMRWLPVAPLAIPHRAMADGMYNNYFIPKDSLVIANVWKFLHDPNVYKDPFIFNPDRFLGPNPSPDPTDLGVFGYGLFALEPTSQMSRSGSTSQRLLRGSQSLVPLDSSGNEVDPVAETMDGIISRPIPFTCKVAPRSEQIMQLQEMLQICRAEDGQVFQVNAGVRDIERIGSLELFLHQETGIDQDSVLAYLPDGRRLTNTNIRELNGSQTQSIYVFNKYYLDLPLDDVLRELRVEAPLQPPIEDDIAATPPFRPSQLGASYLRTAHIHREHISHILSSLHAQHDALRIASTSLSMHVLAIVDTFEGVASSSRPRAREAGGAPGGP